MWRNWNIQSLLVESLNGTATLQKSLTVPRNIRHKVTIWPSKLTPRHIPKTNESMCTCRNMYVNFQISIFQKSQMSINSQTYKQNMGYSHNGILCGSKKRMNYSFMLQHGWTLTTSWFIKKASHKRPHIVGFLSWNVQKRQIHGKRKKISSCLGLGGSEWGVTGNEYSRV